MQFIQARHYTPGRIRPIRVGVIHAMQAPENIRTAENVAAWFAGSTAPQASTHLNGDADSVVESVKPGDTAWCAPGANADGYHLEHAGYSEQTAAQWLDDFSVRTIRNLAAAAAPVLLAAGIPPRFLTDQELGDGRTKGLTTHAQVTRVLNGGRGHWDPGTGFPFAEAAKIYAEEFAKASPGRIVATGGKYLTEDGILDRGTVKVVQAWVGATRDGDIGPQTLGLLQKRIGRPSNGRWAQADTDTLARLVGAADLVGHPWSYRWATKPDPLTQRLESYLNRGLRAGTFNPAA